MATSKRKNTRRYFVFIAIGAVVCISFLKISAYFDRGFFIDYAKFGYTSALRRAVRLGVDVNSIQDGKTALMWATLHGQKGSVKTLLDLGADPNLKDSEGHTALWLAQRYNPNMANIIKSKR